jgi:hypothetical protein
LTKRHNKKTAGFLCDNHNHLLTDSQIWKLYTGFGAGTSHETVEEEIFSHEAFQRIDLGATLAKRRVRAAPSQGTTKMHDWYCFFVLRAPARRDFYAEEP